MEDLSDLSLNIDSDGKVNCFEDLYTNMDEYNDSGKSSRPSSTVSFSSWTFSPIPATDGGIPEEQDSSASDHQSSTNQQPCSLTVQPLSIQADHQQRTPYLQPTAISQQPQMNNPHCEYYYHPNSVTYHHSVNIHNYVGNYCVGAPVWKDMYSWDGSQAYPSLTAGHDQSHTNYVQVVDQQDPLANLNAPGLEFTRCSTPEYLMALNSLNQLDSPPKPNHSAAKNFSYTSSFDESVTKSNSIKHDSGYSSDLNVSPIIQYQDVVTKPIKRPTSSMKQTSTPNPYPALRVGNIHQFNKENINSLQHRFAQTRNTMAMPGFTPKPISSERQTGFMPTVSRPTTLQQLQATVQQIDSKPITMPIFAKPTCAKFKSVASFQEAKKKAQNVKSENTNSLKRKFDNLEEETGASNASSDSIKRRRHNEPLNNNALELLSDWYERNCENPYPNKADKEMLAKEGGITLSQVKSWFANKRNRSNNTRPKKQKQEMEGKLLEICHQLARDARKPVKDNAYYIQQLSAILDTTKTSM